MPQASETMRKSPTQARAAQTVDAIVEAATQILQSDGEEALTTNRIAERAGVSIGSLYQYFADKEAIVEAIAERERDKIVAAHRQVAERRGPGGFRERGARSGPHAGRRLRAAPARAPHRADDDAAALAERARESTAPTRWRSSWSRRPAARTGR